ncbi:MAG TPA: prepilin-type N-terminal cleavage/methylation domain-containing protein [Burkholderiales bacterium]|nr:prepilin-type N-terminal cleavage/methylation domain-containing protein [Burkholderiales bacterium]
MTISNPQKPNRTNYGFTLIELMIAMTLGILLSGVAVMMFAATSSANRIQDGERRVIENARFAMATIVRDLRASANQYCLNYSGSQVAANSGGNVYVDNVKPLTAQFNATGAPYWLGAPGASVPYGIDPAEFILGSECNPNCNPAPSQFNPLRQLPLNSAPGTQVASGADVLSLRYISGSGLPVTSINSTQQDGVPVSVTVASGSTNGMVAAILADCSNAVFSQVTASGSNGVTFNNANGINDTAPSMDPKQARLFNLDTDFTTVTYYLRLNPYTPSNGAPTKTISTLVRKVLSGGAYVDNAIADGIERLDFLYHVEDPNGNTSVLYADQVDALTSASCRSVSSAGKSVAATASCGWRSLKGIEVFLLANSVDDIASTDSGQSTNGDAFRYEWKNDGSENTTADFETPSDYPTLRNGLPPGRMLRRSLRTFVAMRGYNH